MQRRRTLPWPPLFALFGAIAVLCLLWIAHDRDPLSELSEAIGSDLNLDVRLTSFHPPAETPVRRSSARIARDLSPEARIAIARLEKQARKGNELAGPLGVAYLVKGDVDRALSILEQAAAAGASASTLSDLSAAYLVKAQRAPIRKVENLARALDAATGSLRVHPSNEARFNRAIALQQLSSYVGPLAAWDEYLQHESDARWVAAANRHRTTAHEPQNAGVTWEARRAALRERLMANDRAFVIESVRLFPEAAIEFFDQDLLLEWAGGEMSMRGSRERTLRAAEGLADAIAEVTHDVMPRDIVRTLRAGGDRGRHGRTTELAAAQLAYADAVRKYRADDYAGAMADEDVALRGFRRSQSPQWAWVALQRAVILFQRRELGESSAQLETIESMARARGYTTLLGRTLQQHGLTYSKQWHLPEALEMYRAAVTCFVGAGEQEQAVAVHSLMADALRSLGEHHESWEYIGRTLDGLDRIRTPLRRYLILFNASLFALNENLLETALLFQNSAVREATNRGGGTVIEALTERATILGRRGETEAALGDLREARQRLESMSDGPLRQYHRAEIDVLAADLASTPTDADVRGLGDALVFFAKAEPTHVPRLYLALARARLAMGSIDSAESAFVDGVSQLEHQQALVGDEALRISYFDESWSLFPELVRFEINVRHDFGKAFEFAERSRARSLLGDSRPVELHELQGLLPDSIVLLYYVTLPDRVLMWKLTRTEARLSERAIESQQLASLITRYRSELEDESADASDTATRLYRDLIEPANGLGRESTVVIVADGELQRVPFSALRNPQTSRYLIEEHPVVSAPSATFFARALARSKRYAGQRLSSALLVGNPASSTSSAALPSLPGAETEAIQATALYPRHEVLTGVAATKDRFLRMADSYDVVHFGGHAFVNDEHPLLSRLSFASEGQTGEPQSLFAFEISKIHFTHTRLVVLAACSTAAGSVSRGEGVVSIARPFLAAGVPLVIASHWDVDDDAAAQLSLAFHRALSELGDEVKALRSAQLSLLHSGDSRLAAPRSWAAFLALGTTVQ